MAYNEDDPFKDENRPPLPELPSGSGSGNSRQPDEPDEEYRQRPEKSETEQVGMNGHGAGGESVGAESLEVLRSIYDEVQRMRSILERITS